MSNPSVTATINVDDKASPALKELARLAKMIAQETAQALKGGSGDGLAASYNRANAAAKEHLGTLNSIRNVHKQIAGLAAGIAGTKMFQGAKEAVSNFLPYEKATRYQTSIQSFNKSDQKLLDDQRLDAARRLGVMPMDTLKAQQAFVTRNYNASITRAATSQALVLAKALDIPADEAAKIVEGQTFSQGIHLTDADQASREMHRSADRAAIASKVGAMTPEDLSQFSKYAIGMSSAAGISPDQAFAMGMTLKKNNVGGDESGVFVRQLSARLMAPTQKGFDAFAHMGINYGDYSDPDVKGGLTADAIDARMREHYAGKGLTAEAKEGLKAALEDETRNVLGSRSEFTAAIREAVEASGETLSKTDQKHLSTTALSQYDIARKNLRGGDLLEAILARATPKDIQALMGDKQGGRATQLLPALDQYHEFVGRLGHADGYADEIAAKRMEGLGAAADRLSTSFDAASKKLVAANQGLLEKGADLAGKVVGSALDISPERMQSLTAAGALGAGAAALAATSSIVNLASAASAAAASLWRVAGGNAAGAVAAGATGSRVAGATGLASRGLMWAAVAAVLGPELMDLTKSEAAGTDDTKGGGAANYRRRMRELHAQQTEMEDLVANDAGAFDKFQPAAKSWNAARGTTGAYLRQLNAIGEGAGGGNGWQDSASVNVGQSSGFKGVSVTGTVSGSAEIHQSIEVRPSAYLESVVKRAESVASMGLNGRLGTSMQGPGDSSTKPSGGALTGTQ